MNNIIYISRKTQLILNKEQEEYIDTMIYVRRNCWNKLVETYNPIIEEKLNNKEKNVLPSKTTLENFVKSLDLPKVHSRVYRTCCSDYLTSWERVFNKNIPNNLRRKPKFHSCNNELRVNFNDIHSKILNGKITLPRYSGCKIKKDIKFCEDLSKFNNVPVPIFSISKRNNKYYISLTFKIENYEKIQSGSNEVGCDWGLKEFLTCSNNTIYSLPKSLIRQEIRIKTLQKYLSKKQRNSKNYNKLKVKLNKAWIRYTNIRKEFIEKKSYELCKNNKLIVLEDLDIQEMISKSHRNRRRNIYKNCFNIFKTRLIQKSERFTCKVIFVDKYYASSQICSNCGRKHKMPVSKRVYKCDCGLILDRDLNASINILKEGQRMLSMS